MAKIKSIYACNACGSTYPRWMGQCTDCDEWNTIEEQQLTGTITKQSGKAKAAKITSLQTTSAPEKRTDTGISEFNRVLGGGLVDGSAILIGGDPGIGKSTILLQAAANLTKIGKEVLYISGEESAYQIQMRAKRLGVENAPISLSSALTLEVILATIAQEKPDIVIIDSIQTVYSESSDSVPGSVSQVRIAAHELIQTAKRSGCIIIFVGHVTKDGNIAGPRILEHMVDSVMYFEGDRGNSFRLLRSFKNRFGSTGEIGVFEMSETGLKEVPNPSATFLAERPENAPGSAVLPAMSGTRPILVEIQALVSATNQAQPRRTTLGVDHARVAMIAAVLDKHGGFSFSDHDIFLNVTGGMKINEPAADLAIAAALVSSLMNKPINQSKLIFGEIGLSGEVRNVNYAEQRMKEAEKLGFSSVITPPIKNEKTSSKLEVTHLRRVSNLGSTIFE
ncbi:MAG: DNA repair protein RadA/Sms [Alphaproteobacteria bacterium]|jgi:DNA repair protein RadA/Sms